MQKVKVVLLVLFKIMLEQFERYFNREIVVNGFDYFDYELLLASEPEFSLLPDNAVGLYSWYFYPKYALDEIVRPYNKFFKSREYTAVVQSILKEEYRGTLKGMHISEDLKFSSFDFSNPDSSIYLTLSSIFFTPPIYIGRSTNLKRRLNQHLDLLRDIISTGDYEKNLEILNKNITDEQLDEEFESTCFATRVGKIIKAVDKDSDLFQISNFFVKVLIFKRDISDEDLNKIEYFLNRTFNPLAGLR